MAPRLLRHALARWADPGAVFTTLVLDDTDVAWLDSGVGATEGFSYLGRAARTVAGESRRVLDEIRGDLTNQTLAPEADGFALGWVGWIDYETRFATMDEPAGSGDQRGSAAFLYLDRAVEFDHAAGVVSLIALGDTWSDDLARWRDETIARIETAPPVPFHLPVPKTTAARWRDSDDHYLEMIRDCQRAIAAGDAYQLCLTTSAHVDGSHSPRATYLALRASSPSHHGGLIRIGDVSLLSSSPERFLRVTPDGRVESKPIKGTRPRGHTPEQDARLADELRSSDKERAENLMIVDLMRNDIGRVSEVGSVEVTSLLAVETYAHVHQLVSTVVGRMADGLQGMDAVLACFPAGSMTGAPKSSAVRILASLENAPRGIYSGVFGYFGLDGRIDLAMVIRSIVISPDGATVGAGGGITILSDPDAELAETKLKAAALLGVLGAR
jgi:anthranilate synthase component 1